jgi:hypothetical protein
MLPASDLGVRPRKRKRPNIVPAIAINLTDAVDYERNYTGEIMGTLFHFDQEMPASDEQARGKDEATRQVEIFTSSGDHEIHLRIGNLNEQHQGTGFSVHLDKARANELLEGLQSAMAFVGYTS